MWVEDRHDGGQGARFVVELPLVEPDDMDDEGDLSLASPEAASALTLTGEHSAITIEGRTERVRRQPLRPEDRRAMRRSAGPTRSRPEPGCGHGDVVIACGIASDDSPRPLAIATTSTTEAPSTATSGGTAAVLYYLRDGKLVPDHEIAAGPNPRHRDERAVERRRIGRSPARHRYRDPDGQSTLKDLSEGTDATELNLSSEFENVVGPKRQQAIAQLVMTATEFPDIDSLRFEVNDKVLQVTSPTRGDTTTVNACDFALLLPTAEQAEGSQLPASGDRTSQPPATGSREELPGVDPTDPLRRPSRPTAPGQDAKNGRATPLKNSRSTVLSLPTTSSRGTCAMLSGLEGDHVPQSPSAAASAAATP